MVETVVTIVEDEDEEARLIFKKVMSLTWKVIIWCAGYYKFCIMIVMLVVYFNNNKNKNNNSKSTGSKSVDEDHTGIVGAIVAGILWYLGMFAAWMTIIYVDLVKRLESFVMLKNYCIQQRQEDQEGSSSTTIQRVIRLEDLGGPFLYLPIISFTAFMFFCSSVTGPVRSIEDVDNEDVSDTNSIIHLMVMFVLPVVLSGHMGCFFFQIYRDLKLLAQRRYEAATTVGELQEQPTHHQKMDETISCPQILEASSYGNNGTVIASDFMASSSASLPCSRCSANERRLLKEENDKFSDDYRHWEIERIKLGQMIHDAVHFS